MTNGQTQRRGTTMYRTAGDKIRAAAERRAELGKRYTLWYSANGKFVNVQDWDQGGRFIYTARLTPETEKTARTLRSLLMCGFNLSVARHKAGIV